MNEIHVFNDYSFIHSSDKALLNQLWILLRFRSPGYIFTPAYKNKRWDGFNDFFDRKKNRFLTGLLIHVVYIIKKQNKPYKIIDHRENFQFAHTTIDEHFLDNCVPKEFLDRFESLHDFQPDLVNQAIKHKRGIIQAPTGAGKTLMLVSFLKCLPPKTPVLFLTYGTSLVQQTYDEALLWGIKDVGRWYGKYKEPNYVTFANIHPATFKGLDKLLPKFKVLIVDEIHKKALTDVPIKAYGKMIKASVRIGISATPFKDDGKDEVEKYKTIGHFGPVLLTKTTESGKITTQNLKDRGILSDTKGTFYVIKEPDLVYEPYIDAVTLGIAENITFLSTVKKLTKSLTGRTLIIVERVKQGEMLKEMMPEAHWIYGKVKVEDRLPALQDLKYKGDVVAIVMQQIISDGINVFIHNLINAAGGQAHHSIIQRMGRGMRLANDKNILNYYDFIFRMNPHLLKHSEKRFRVLKQEGHDVEIKEEIDF